MWYFEMAPTYVKHTPYGMGDRTSDLDTIYRDRVQAG